MGDVVDAGSLSVPGVPVGVWGTQVIGVTASDSNTVMGGVVAVSNDGIGEGLPRKRQKRKNKHPAMGVRAMADIHRQRTKDFAQGEQQFRNLGADPYQTWENLDKACEFLQSLPGFQGNRMVLGGRNPSTGSSGSKQYILCSMRKAPSLVADERRRSQAGGCKCPWFLMYELSMEGQWVLYAFCKDITYHNHEPPQAGVDPVSHVSKRLCTSASLIKGHHDIMVSLNAVGECCSSRGISDMTLHQVLVDIVEKQGYTADFTKDDVSNAYKIGAAPPVHTV